jgi:hypothetical protein
MKKEKNTPCPNGAGRNGFYDAGCFMGCVWMSGDEFL